jgi:dolichyl-phosphate beta-glucosyltransferase
MYGFHFCVQVLGGVYHIRDTQCGFKLFTRKAAQILFTSQHLRRWCFDVELLFICGQLGIPVSEVSVNWQEIPGSKVRLIEASLLMGRDLLVIRFSYLLRIWRIEDPSRHTHSMHAPTQDNNELRRR